MPVADLINPSGKPIDPLFVGTDSAGRVLVSGRIRFTPERHAYCCLRMTSTGIIDTSFADKGFFIGNFVASNEERHYSRIEQVVELSDGKLLLIGGYHGGTLSNWKGVMRLHADGRLDTSFGKQGMTLIALGTIDTDSVTPSARAAAASTPRSVNNIPVLPDGKLLLHGTIYNTSLHMQSVIIRLTPEGALDTSFNDTGLLRIAHPSYNFTVVADILLEDGKYVLTGYCATQNLRRAVGMLARLLSTGEPDTSFNRSGYLFIDSNDDPRKILNHRIVSQTNRRLLGIGAPLDLSNPEYSSKGLLTSRESDGSKNIQFNGGEPLLTERDGQSISWYNARIQADGSIQVYGVRHRIGCVMAKFTDAGVLDLTFDNRGWRIFPGRPTVILSSVLTDETALYLAYLDINGRSVASVARGLLQ